MKDIKVFNTVEEVYKMLGKECPAKYWSDSYLIEEKIDIDRLLTHMGGDGE